MPVIEFFNRAFARGGCGGVRQSRSKILAFKHGDLHTGAPFETKQSRYVNGHRERNSYYSYDDFLACFALVFHPIYLYSQRRG